MSTSARARMSRRYAADLRPNERLIPTYAVDCALCDCESVADDGVPMIPVANGVAPWGSYDRCLLCGTVWRGRDYRFDPSEIMPDPGVSLGVSKRGGAGNHSTDIIRLTAQGFSDVEIAQELGLSPSRVRELQRRAA